MKRRVVKIGGSLFEIRELGKKLRVWLNENNSMQNIVVVGGGGLADVIRRLERTQHFDSQQSHELACRSLSLTAKLMAYSIDEAHFCCEFKTLHESKTPIVIFDSSSWILDQPNVPQSWDCLLYTSPSPRDLSTSRMPSSA